MKIVIAGTGEVGGNLITNLSNENLQIVAIDPNPTLHEKYQHLPNVRTVQTDMLDSGTLDADLFKQVDLFLAVTNSDEANMVACLLAEQLGVKKTICRASHSLASSVKVLGVDHWINPTEICVDELLRLIMAPNSVASFPFCGEKMLLIGFRIHPFSKIVGQDFESLQADLIKQDTVLACWQCGDLTSLPSSISQQRVKSGDILYFLVYKQHLQRLRKLLGYQKSGGNKVFINGGGQVGLLLAQRLEQQKKHVKIIELNEPRSKQIASELSEALVLNIEGTNTVQLFAEGLSYADYFIAVTDHQPTNIVSAAIAAEAGVPYSITLLDHAACVPIVASNSPIYLGISPRQLTARYLSQFIHGEHIKIHFPIANSEVEFFELNININFEAGTRVADLALPQGSQVCLVERQAEVSLIQPSTQLYPKDTVVLATHRIDRRALLKIFQPE